jgi:hypothetical protein
MTFTNSFKLHLAFTVSSWIRVDGSPSGNGTLFSKDNNAGTPDLLFRTYVSTDLKLNVAVAKPASVATIAAVTSTNAISADDWTFAAIAIQLNTDGVTSTVNFRVNNAGNDTKTFASGHYYLDSVTPHTAYIGGYRTGASVWAENFKGFMFNIYVENVYLSIASAHYRTSCTSVCTDETESCAT